MILKLKIWFYSFFQKTLKPIAFKLGFTLKKENDKNLNLLNSLRIIKQLGFEPFHVLDIGANRGTWSREVLQIFPNAMFSLIEPQNWLKSYIMDLNNYNVKFYPIGISNSNKTLNFTIHDRDDSSSFRYSQNESKVFGLKSIDVEVQTLDYFLKSNELPIPEIIKIDAEGLDLEVLEGANSCLGVSEIFLVEASINNSVFSNSIEKVIKKMDNYGYRLFEITDLNRPFENKILWLVELMFIKKNGELDIEIKKKLNF